MNIELQNVIIIYYFYFGNGYHNAKNINTIRHCGMDMILI